MSLRIDVNTKRYDIKIKLIRNSLPQLQTIGVSRAADIVQSNMENSVPVRTGKLRRSIEKVVSTTSAVVRTATGYGKAVDVGTKPRIIFGNPILRFEILGKTIFARSVKFPGFRGRFYSRKTIEESRLPILAEMLKIWEDLTGGR